jgi:hypothetical protein
MNPNIAFQLYETQRPRTRTQVIVDDATRGHRAAAVSRAYRALTRRARIRTARVTLGPSLRAERRCS